MRPYHRAPTAASVLACTGGLLGAMTVAPAVAAPRVAPVAGVLYIGTATEDGVNAGAVSVRVGPGGASLVSLLGGHFHGDLCAGDEAMFAGPGGINPVTVSLSHEGAFSGTEVTAAPDGARLARSLHGVFSPTTATASAVLSYSDTPISGARACTVTAKLSLHKAPLVPSGKLTPPRKAAIYHAVSHQGWAENVTVSRAGGSASRIEVSAWDVCHYQALTSVHFLYPEHLLATAAIAHGRFSTRVTYTGGSGKVTATVTGQFVGPGHHLAGAVHVTRSGTIDGNAFVCDSQRVAFSGP